MLNLAASYFDGVRPLRTAVTISLHGQQLTVQGEGIEKHYALEQLRVSPRVADDRRFIALPDGAQLLCPENEMLQYLPQEVRTEGLVAWLERHTLAAVISLLLTIAILISAHTYGMPVLAKKAVEFIPLQVEQELAKQALLLLDEKEWFSETRLPSGLQQELQASFGKLRNGLPMADLYRLEFRKSKFLGENALAFPGGMIVITDEMVEFAETEEEVLAVLAHEIAHVELRHSLRSVLESSMTAIIAATLVGDATSLSAVVVGLPTMLARLSYSREHEAEADAYAFQLLERHGYSPEAFATLMARLEKTEKRGGVPAWLSSHPQSQERIDKARQASGE